MEYTENYRGSSPFEDVQNQGISGDGSESRGSKARLGLLLLTSEAFEGAMLVILCVRP